MRRMRAKDSSEGRHQTSSTRGTHETPANPPSSEGEDMAQPRDQKRRKVKHDHDPHTSNHGEEDTSRPSAVYHPKGGRQHTLSIALPGSIIANAVSHDQKTTLAGHIARACAVFCVDEIVIFDDGQATIRDPEKGGYTAFSDPNFFLFHILSYLETPPHLRKALFPMHPDLRTAGTLPSLDLPHHMRSNEDAPYREGITTSCAKGRSTSGTPVYCGLSQEVSVPVELDENVRVTIRLPAEKTRGSSDVIEADVVSPDTPREEAGYYWGYSVRQASSLSKVFTECEYDGGYDASIGTSERGRPATSLADRDSADNLTPHWQHLLIVFGGVAGLEVALSHDDELLGAGVKEPSEVFDHWINLVPGQGSRTIRTEEAVWIGLACLRPLVDSRARV